MRMSRMALAVAGAFPFVLGITYAGASSAFAQTAGSTRSTVDVLYAPFLLPTPWYLLGTPTRYHTQQDHIEAKIACDVSPTVPYPQRSYFAEFQVSL